MSDLAPKFTPNWFGDAVAAGLQRLVALRLPGTPAADMLQATAKVWIGALLSRPIDWQEARDLPRIRQAFLTLTATMDHWPSPSEFMAAFPRAEPLDVRRLSAPMNNRVPPKVREFLDQWKKRHVVS